MTDLSNSETGIFSFVLIAIISFVQHHNGEGIPIPLPLLPEEPDISDNIFTQDEQLLEIQSLEKMLRMCDTIDFKIIGGLFDGKSYTKIGDALYISESSVKYRIKRMLNNSGIESIVKILELYKKYIKS